MGLIKGQSAEGTSEREKCHFEKEKEKRSQDIHVFSNDDCMHNELLLDRKLS